jgi:hypothetical protein
MGEYFSEKHTASIFTAEIILILVLGLNFLKIITKLPLYTAISNIREWRYSSTHSSPQ